MTTASELISFPDHLLPKCLNRFLVLYTVISSDFVFNTPCNVSLLCSFTPKSTRFMMKIHSKCARFAPQMYPFHVFNVPLSCRLTS